MSTKLFEILVTEGKSQGHLNMSDRTVRVFVDKDMTYGKFMSEHDLFAMLSPQQQEEYLGKSDVSLKVERDVAQTILDVGSPRSTQKLRE